jgi:hypothetical protein
MAHPGGRPTEYCPEIIEKVKEYFEQYESCYECPVEKQDKDGNVTTKMERIPNPPPDFIGLAKYLGVTRWTVWNWIKKIPEFSNAVKDFGDHIYSHILQENALMGNYSQPFAIFAAKNRLGWKDKSEITGGEGRPLIPDLSGALQKIYSVPPQEINESRTS